MSTPERTVLGVSENLTASIKVFKKSEYSSDAILVLTGTRRPEKGVEETFTVPLNRDPITKQLLVPDVLIGKMSAKVTPHEKYTHYPFTGLYRVSAEAKVALAKKGDPFKRTNANGETEEVVEHNFRFEDTVALVVATPALEPKNLAAIAL